MPSLRLCTCSRELASWHTQASFLLHLPSCSGLWISNPEKVNGSSCAAYFRFGATCSASIWIHRSSSHSRRQKQIYRSAVKAPRGWKSRAHCQPCWWRRSSSSSSSRDSRIATQLPSQASAPAAAEIKPQPQPLSTASLPCTATTRRAEGRTQS